MLGIKKIRKLGDSFLRVAIRWTLSNVFESHSMLKFQNEEALQMRPDEFRVDNWDDFVGPWAEFVLY